MLKIKLPMVAFLSLIVILFSSSLAGCASKSAQAGTSMEGLTMAPTGGMPDEVRNAPVTVQQAYQFAVANPDTMKQIPCYCGCGSMGHTSNYNCYVNGVDASGKVNYDTHALGCSICVDITQDVMRLIKDKKPIQEIKTYIDSTYSKYGPSNISSTSSLNGTPAATESAHIGQATCKVDASSKTGSTCPDVKKQ